MTVTADPVSDAHKSGELYCRLFRDGKLLSEGCDPAEISNHLEQPGTLVWVDVIEPDQEDLATLREEFNLHPLAVEDAVTAHERPKIEGYGHFWFLILQATTFTGDALVFHELALFAGTNFLITVRHDPPYPLTEAEARWQAHPEGVCAGAGFLLYTILDTVVDDYFPVVEAYEDKVDRMEESLFDSGPMPRNLLPQIFAMKREAQRFRHAVIPMRDILNPLIRRDMALFPEEDTLYFRDVYDHAIRIIDQLDTMRDLVNSSLEIHLSVVANRQAEVAKQLTLVATIFLPLSFIVGFFGQNFGFLVSHIQGTATFWWLGMGVELLAVTLTFGYFKVKGWF